VAIVEGDERRAPTFGSRLRRHVAEQPMDGSRISTVMYLFGGSTDRNETCKIHDISNANSTVEGISCSSLCTREARGLALARSGSLAGTRLVGSSLVA
jgi:hypothetical protein